MSPSLRVAALASLLCACNGKLKIPEIPKINLGSLQLPKAPNGNAIIIQASTARIEIDPTARDALTAVGTCSDLVTYCLSPDRSLEACVAAAPDCATGRPWEEATACCPAACKTGFASAIKANEDPLAAFERVFFLEPDCFPDVRAALEGS